MVNSSVNPWTLQWAAAYETFTWIIGRHGFALRKGLWCPEFSLGSGTLTKYSYCGLGSREEALEFVDILAQN